VRRARHPALGARVAVDCAGCSVRPDGGASSREGARRCSDVFRWPLQPLGAPWREAIPPGPFARRHVLGSAPGVLPGVYEPRSTAETVLHEVVRTHLTRFLDETAAATDGAGVPRFIERELRDFLDCGDLRRGFCRIRCDDCAFERLVPFSCKA